MALIEQQQKIGYAHTILLIQPSRQPQSRTYSDYESVKECMEGVCQIYEEHLKQKNPNCPKLTYDMSQLFFFIDQVQSEFFISVIKKDKHLLYFHFTVG